jgi:hypothetical protein
MTKIPVTGWYILKDVFGVPFSKKLHRGERPNGVVINGPFAHEKDAKAANQLARY